MGLAALDGAGAAQETEGHVSVVSLVRGKEGMAVGSVRRELHRGNDAGFWSGLFGVAALVLGWIPVLGATVADILGILAVLFGLVGLMRPGSKRLALLGIVLGVIMLVLKQLPILSFL